MSGTPLLSVFIPAYNVEKYVREAVESVLDNGFADFELVVLDDCSTDATAAVVQSIRHPALRLVRNAANLGFGPMRQHGLSLLRGRHAAFLDGDDIALPGRFALQVARLEAADGPDIHGGGDELFGDIAATRLFPQTDGAIKAFMLMNCPFDNSTICMRLEHIRAGRIRYPQDTEPAEDYALWVGAMMAGLRLENAPLVLSRYRRHGESVTAKWGRRVNAQARLVRRRVIDHYFPLMADAVRTALADVLSRIPNGGQRWVDGVYAMAQAAMLADDVPQVDAAMMRNYLAEYLILMIRHGMSLGVVDNEVLEMMTETNADFERWRMAGGGALDAQIMALQVS